MKEDRYKTKEQLINEIQELRKRLTDLKESDTQSQPVKETSFILEEALKESEERYRVLTEKTMAGIYLVQDGKFRYVNPAFEQIHGYTSDEIINKIGPTDLAIPEDRDFLKEKIRQRISGEIETDYFQLRIKRKDGTIRYLEVYGSRANFKGRPSILGTCIDITARKEAEEALLVIRKAVESTSDAIGMSDLQGHHFYHNKSFTNLFEYTAEELEAAGGGQVAFSSSDTAREVFDSILNGRSWSGETEMISKSGHRFPVLLRADAIKDDVGRIISVLGTFTDITERKQAETELKKSEEKYRSIVEYAAEGIYQTTRGGQLIMANKSFLQMLGYDSFEELAQRIRDIGKQLYVEPGQREELMRMLEKQNVVSGFETQLYRKDGSTVWVSFNVRTVRDSKDNLLYNEGTMEDITYRKQVEESTRQNMDRLRKAIGGTIDVITMAVEARDPYTSGHQRRVSSLARSIAKEMDLSQEVIDGIRMAGVIHDLGKISIPAEILSMPRKLTELEFGLVKAHPQIGYDILKDIEFPYPIAQIVLQHHERLDGSGYPLGLKNVDIILEAKILAVADVVEAIASHRPYRPAKGIDVALEEIEKDAGILYDREVVEACLKLFREKGFKLE